MVPCSPLEPRAPSIAHPTLTQAWGVCTKGEGALTWLGQGRPLGHAIPWGELLHANPIDNVTAGGIVLAGCADDPLQRRIYRYLTNSHKRYGPGSFDGARYALIFWPRRATARWDRLRPALVAKALGHNLSGGKWQSPPATESSWLRLFPARVSPPFRQRQNRSFGPSVD